MFMNDDESGFQIDCSNFFFIITSNMPLPELQELESAYKKLKSGPTTSYIKMEDLHAIRTRTRYNMVNCNREEMWGSIAYVLLNDDGAPNRTKDEIMFILDWMWNNRYNMTEFNVRTAIDMGDLLESIGIEDVKDRWNYDFIG
jgi:hypothetical protein